MARPNQWNGGIQYMISYRNSATSSQTVLAAGGTGLSSRGNAPPGCHHSLNEVCADPEIVWTRKLFDVSVSQRMKTLIASDYLLFFIQRGAAPTILPVLS